MAKSSSRRYKNVQPAQEPKPPSKAPSPSPSFSDSSMEDASNFSEIQPEASYGYSASRPGSPTQSGALDTEDSVTCQWEDCGEKPFVCALPECDKSFTRSDALAKHMRLQHNISPPAPGRGGGSRKRKRAPDDQTQDTSVPVASSSVPAPYAIPNATGFTTFKIQARTASEAMEDMVSSRPDSLSVRSKTSTNGRQKRQLRQNPLLPHNTPSPDMQGEEEDGYTSSSSDILPPHLQSRIDDKTGLVLGRSPAMVMYLLMKAKHHHAHEENEQLLEQLKVVKAELKKEKEEKEASLDQFFQAMLKEDAQFLISLPEQEPVIGDGTEVAHGSSQRPLGIPIDDMGVSKPSWVPVT